MALKTHLEAKAPKRAEAFMKSSQPFAQKIISGIKAKQYSLFFQGASMNPESGEAGLGLAGILDHRDGNPVLIFLKDGLVEASQ